MKSVEELGISPHPWWIADGIFVSSEDGNVCVTIGIEIEIDDKERANARLIAAAPEMYNALQFVFEHIAFQCFDGKNEVVEKAKELVRTALTKASGEDVYIG